jgi:hypothetical protein
MKCILSCLLVLLSLVAYAQNHKAVAFQAVARTNYGVIMPNKQIQVRISILSDTVKNSIVYQEVKSVITSPLGLFTVLIGIHEPTKIITEGNFEKINWAESIHFIRIEIDPDNHLQFIRIGQQPINYVAYAFTADHLLAANIDGVVSVAQGGTGVNTLPAFKMALQLDKVNNVADSGKSLSKAAIVALNLKLDKKDTSSLSNRINQKLNKGDISKTEIEQSLGFLPIQVDFGHFFDTARQITNINTAMSVKWRDTITNSHIYISNNSSLEPSKISVLKEGVYLVQYTVQASNPQIANDEISIWIRRNGSAYPNSLRQFTTGAIGTKNILSAQTMIPLGKEDYVELFFSVRHAQTQLIKTNSLSSPSRPAMPSAQIILFKIQ